MTIKPLSNMTDANTPGLTPRGATGRPGALDAEETVLFCKENAVEIARRMNGWCAGGCKTIFHPIIVWDDGSKKGRATQ